MHKYIHFINKRRSEGGRQQHQQYPQRSEKHQLNNSDRQIKVSAVRFQRRLTKMFRNSSRMSPLLFFQGSRVRPPEDQTYPLYDVAPLHLAASERHRRDDSPTISRRRTALPNRITNLQDLLFLAPVQAGRHVEDMSLNLLEL
ncbi:PREDICTED: uncharacterized protein LOC108358716 [Rhagoletis zephyria]|uniref:uncharacterized protein LOC108358716 n=1 Tax=Rhagoletis zephyria TaxID=28612 RepID=UPI0008113C20|nr:PREDICTED: uncharacterized protein LOC108358716 [Rhagoletis zephyria]